MNYLQIRNNEPILYEGKTVIAGPGTNLKVNLSELSEDEKKAIGWGDVEACAKLAIPNYENRMDDEIKFAREKFKQGFKAAQSLNERMFTEEDMGRLWQFIVDGAKQLMLSGTTNVGSFEDYIKSIQPKRYPCELETESILVNSKGTPIYPDTQGEWRETVKVVNDSITVKRVII